jgi:hypothetical protein
MTFQMQASVPGLINVSDEAAKILEMYGTKGADGSFAANCLLARRLAQRDVRFIQLYHRDWGPPRQFSQRHLDKGRSRTIKEWVSFY